MTVKAILSAKGYDVVTIDPAANLAAAVKLLAERKIGAVIVLDRDGRPAGILSERDIVRAIAERGAAALEERVDRLMTRRVFTCGQGETIGRIMEWMTEGKFRHLPVVEEGRLIGLVSIGDVVKYRVAEIERETTALRDYILTA